MSSVAFRIVNPIKAYYILGNQVNQALRELAAANLRNVVGEHVLEEVLSGRKKIMQETRELVVSSLPPGISVESIFIEDLSIPPQTLKDLSAAAKQRRIS